MLRWIMMFATCGLLAACGETQLNEAKEDLGEFSARVTFVYTDKALIWPTSRAATGAEWQVPLQQALDTRLRRYEGSQEYDVSISLEGFVLAPPGIPILFAPKSLAVVYAYVYDVEKEEFLVRKHRMEIFESTTGESALVGSGHARTKEEQIDGLSLNIVDALEEYMAEQHAAEGWFAPSPASGPAQGL